MRYIDADQIRYMWQYDADGEEHDGVTLQSIIRKLPTADGVEVRHGEWRDRYGEKYANRLYECSLCEEIAPEGTVYDELDRPLRQQVLSPYCPNCGAKMNGEGRTNND